MEKQRKKAAVIIALLFLSSCAKEQPCNCGRILSDNAVTYSITVRNECSGHEKTFALSQGDWMNAYVGDDICLSNEKAW